MRKGCGRWGSPDAYAPLANLHVAPACEGFDFEEDLGHPLSDVFMVEQRRMSGRRRNRRGDLADHLLAGLVQADDGPLRIVGAAVDLQNVFHRGYKGRVVVWRDLPIP